MYSDLMPSTPKKSLTRKLLNYAFGSGLLRAGRSLWAKSLTVLNYHRIDDPDREGFNSFKPNVSARIEEFDIQMDYLSRWFKVVSMRDVVDWLDGIQPLPPYAALITFDDGYLDNYTNAYPVLRKYNFPATIFLTTNHIGTDAQFYWDLAAYCFYQTTNNQVRFPDGIDRGWDNAEQRDQICKSWVEAVKPLPDTEKRDWVLRLPDQLNVSIPENFFRNLMMSWDQVGEMHKNGIGFGGHTLNHPILSRIPIEEARREIEGSKVRIEQELGEPVLGFAYPNGMASDINPELERAVEDTGYKAAFTLMNGPSTWREVRQDRFAIRRIFISHRHTLPHFGLLTSRINRYRQ